MKQIADKMAARGVAALDDRELLALLLEDEQAADALWQASGESLERLARTELPRLRMLGGLGLRRARLLLAAAEYGRRVAEAQSAAAEVIATSDDVVRLFRPRLERLDHEECWVVFLTSSNRII